MTIDNFQNTQPANRDENSASARRQELLREYAGSVEVPSDFDYDRAKKAYLVEKYGEHFS